MNQTLIAQLNGSLYFLYQGENLETFITDPNKEDHDKMIPQEIRLIDNPGNGNQILIFDLPGTEFDYPCSFRTFLYPDHTFLGKVTYAPESNYDPKSLKGTYSWQEDELWLQGEVSYEGEKEDEFLWIFQKA